MNPISKIGLGTVQFGIPYGISNQLGQTPEVEVTSILKYAKETGIDVLDTASAYGASEKVLGKNNLHSFKVVSKFILQENGKNLSAQLNETLESLNLTSIYGYLAHRPMDIVNNPKIWDALNEYKGKGIIKKTGFSFNEVNEIERVLSKNIIPDIVQVPFNYLDNRFQPYMIDLKQKGCEIHTRSPFLQGLFFMNTNNLSSFFDDIKPILNQLQQFGDELPGMLMNFCIGKPFVDKVIFGVNTLEQLKDNLKNILNANNLPLIAKKVSEIILIPSKWPK
jgi:aryl-alcohol dehydrogenase-like predicted oxidoreductase